VHRPGKRSASQPGEATSRSQAGAATQAGANPSWLFHQGLSLSRCPHAERRRKTGCWETQD
jgi:hypothetical protein